MAPFLSRAWFDEVNDAARSGAVRTAAAGASVTVQQIVTDGPDGVVRYWLRVEDGSVEIGRGDAECPDATVTESYATAVAVRSGELAVEDALLAGRIHLTGDVAALLRDQAALQALAGAFAVVRQRTTYR